MERKFVAVEADMADVINQLSRIHGPNVGLDMWRLLSAARMDLTEVNRWLETRKTP